MSKIRYSLFTRFEDALCKFHGSLKEGANHYQLLFQKLLDGEDVYTEVVEDTVFYEIQNLRASLQDEQRRISHIIAGDEGAFLKFSELQERAKDRFEMNLVEIGKECLFFYGEIERYTLSIEKYYRAKAAEYKSFFEGLYESQEKSGYGQDSQKQNGKQGVLVKASV